MTQPTPEQPDTTVLPPIPDDVERLPAVIYAQLVGELAEAAKADAA